MRASTQLISFRNRNSYHASVMLFVADLVSRSVLVSAFEVTLINQLSCRAINTLQSS